MVGELVELLQREIDLELPRLDGALGDHEMRLDIFLGLQDLQKPVTEDHTRRARIPMIMRFMVTSRRFFDFTSSCDVSSLIPMLKAWREDAI